MSVVIVAIAGILLRFPPASHAWYPKCVFYAVTGLHCPGCGTTRALAALVRGSWVEAFWCNPLLIAGSPVMLAGLVLQKRRPRSEIKRFPGLAIFVLVLLIVYFIARNVPTPSTSPLAPPRSSLKKTPWGGIPSDFPLVSKALPSPLEQERDKGS